MKVFLWKTLLPIILDSVSRGFRFRNFKETKRANLWLEWSPWTMSPLFFPFSAAQASGRRSSERHETQSSNKFNARLLQNESWPSPLGNCIQSVAFCFAFISPTLRDNGNHRKLENVFVIILPRKARLELIKGWKCQSRDNKSSLCYHSQLKRSECCRTSNWSKQTFSLTAQLRR